MWGAQWDMAQIDVAEAHAVTTGDPSVVVGVLDSGIYATHPDLATQIASTRAPRASAASSTRARRRGARRPRTTARTSPARSPRAINGVGIAGVAPGVKVASVKVVNDDGFIFPEAAICGYLWAADHGMPVTNNSYFIDPWEFNCVNDPRQRPVWQAVQRALALLLGEGHPHGGLGGQQQRRPAAQVHRLDAARTTAATPSRTAPSPVRAATCRPRRPAS